MPSEMFIFYLIKITRRKILLFPTWHLVPALTYLTALSCIVFLIAKDTVTNGDWS